MSVSHNFGFSGAASESESDEPQHMYSSSYTENNNDVFKPPATRTTRNRGNAAQSDSSFANSLKNQLGGERNAELGRKRPRRNDSSSDSQFKEIENGQLNGHETNGRSLRHRNQGTNKRQHI